MRYLNWDVLLFPGSSRVPLQEFDTKCHVLSDRNNRFIDNAALNSNPYLTEVESMSQIPVLTSFVSSLEQGIPFRVSVHSWELPKPSQILQTFRAPDETIAYEARIYVDGHMVAHRLFHDHTIWPEVIDSTDIDTTHPKPLRFPMFHSEILDQAHWEPGEMYGRIRVVVAEGVTRHRADGKASSVFDRLRDVVAFSFQHAPKHVLEYSGIAWPNSRMFLHAGRPFHGNIVSRITTAPDFEAHAHSPQRQRGPQFPLPFADGGPSTMFTSCTRSADSSHCEDPFTGPVPISLRGKQTQLRHSSNDVSMKDYNSVRTARSNAGTDMSGVSYQRPNFERAMNEAAIEEIVQALSPERKHELLQALSPTQKSSIGRSQMSTGDQKLSSIITPRVRGIHHETAISIEPASEHNSALRALRGSTMTSRYSSVPLLTPSTILPRVQKSLSGLRTSVDPLLTNEWDVANASVDSALGPTQSLLELRPRSSSNASKRKRFDSPSSYAPVEAFNLPSMSTSPYKRSGATPNRSKNASPGRCVTEGIPLNNKK